jgi:hemolysin-activating ACP:hemolysin acyltransferase
MAKTHPRQDALTEAAKSADPLTASLHELIAFTPKDRVYALGLAVNYLMTSPSFARQPFGHWSRVLAGQINRDHYLFAVENDKVVGFLGWSFTSKEKAEDWLTGNAGIASDDGRAGEIMLINAWQADSRNVVRFLLDQTRRIGQDCELVYAKRFHPDGSFRPLRLAVNASVPAHIDSDASIGKE